ncbi:MAG: hypothetical protein V4596_11465 [Bdellovibrionota bacterium]
MRNILLAAVAFCVLTAGTINAQAQNKSVRALLGFTQGAIHLGADFEMKKTNLYGLGGYFFMQTDDKDAAVSEVMALGANMPIHMLTDSNIDVYVAPGFGIAMVDTGLEDETTFGPSLKIGADYKVSATAKVGVQYSKYFNWMTDDITQSSFEYASAAATFAF